MILVIQVARVIILHEFQGGDDGCCLCFLGCLGRGGWLQCELFALKCHNS